MQAADGYAYQVAVHLFNQNFGKSLAASVSTDAQGDWWGGAGGGTVSHSAIACFLGDTAEATMAFAATRPADIPRIALVDFRNDCVGTSREVIRTMFTRYLALLKEGKTEEARKFKLFGVRPDTSANMRDVSVPPLGDKRLDTGVNPRLVFAMREAIDREWMEWDLAPEDEAAGRALLQGRQDRRLRRLRPRQDQEVRGPRRARRHLRRRLLAPVELRRARDEQRLHGRRRPRAASKGAGTTWPRPAARPRTT